LTCGTEVLLKQTQIHTCLITAKGNHRQITFHVRVEFYSQTYLQISAVISCVNTHPSSAIITNNKGNILYVGRELAERVLSNQKLDLKGKSNICLTTPLLYWSYYCQSTELITRQDSEFSQDSLVPRKITLKDILFYNSKRGIDSSDNVYVILKEVYPSHSLRKIRNSSNTDENTTAQTLIKRRSTKSLKGSELSKFLSSVTSIFMCEVEVTQFSYIHSCSLLVIEFKKCFKLQQELVEHIQSIMTMNPKDFFEVPALTVVEQYIYLHKAKPSITATMSEELPEVPQEYSSNPSEERQQEAEAKQVAEKADKIFIIRTILGNVLKDSLVPSSKEPQRKSKRKRTQIKDPIVKKSNEVQAASSERSLVENKDWRIAINEEIICKDTVQSEEEDELHMAEVIGIGQPSGGGEDIERRNMVSDKKAMASEAILLKKGSRKYTKRLLASCTLSFFGMLFALVALVSCYAYQSIQFTTMYQFLSTTQAGLLIQKPIDYFHMLYMKSAISVFSGIWPTTSNDLRTEITSAAFNTLGNLTSSFAGNEYLAYCIFTRTYVEMEHIDSLLGNENLDQNQINFYEALLQIDNDIASRYANLIASTLSFNSGVNSSTYSTNLVPKNLEFLLNFRQIKEVRRFINYTERNNLSKASAEAVSIKSELVMVNYVMLGVAIFGLLVYALGVVIQENRARNDLSQILVVIGKLSPVHLVSRLFLQKSIGKY